MPCWPEKPEREVHCMPSLHYGGRSGGGGREEGRRAHSVVISGLLDPPLSLIPALTTAAADVERGRRPAQRRILQIQSDSGYLPSKLQISQFPHPIQCRTEINEGILCDGRERGGHGRNGRKGHRRADSVAKGTLSVFSQSVGRSLGD